MLCGAIWKSHTLLAMPHSVSWNRKQGRKSGYIHDMTVSWWYQLFFGYQMIVLSTFYIIKMLGKQICIWIKFAYISLRIHLCILCISLNTKSFLKIDSIKYLEHNLNDIKIFNFVLFRNIVCMFLMSLI